MDSSKTQTLVTGLILAALIAGCSSTDDVTGGGSGGTPYDNVSFSGCYYVAGGDECNPLRISIGAGGRLDSLVATGLGGAEGVSVDFTGIVTGAGAFSASGCVSDTQAGIDTCYTFLGDFQKDTNGIISGSGTWSGLFIQSGDTLQSGGAWEVVGSGPDAYEPDISKETIPLIGTDSVAIERYMAVDDTDWVAFDAEAGAVYEVKVAGDDAVPSIGITDNFYRPLSYDDRLEWSPRVARFSCAESGRYYVSLVDLQSDTGSYTITVRRLNQNGPDSVYYLGWTGSGTSPGFRMVRINGSTGFVTKFPDGDFDFFTDLEYGPDGTLYGIGDQLTIVDPSTGGVELVGAFRTDTNGSAIPMRAGFFSPSGVLYVIQLPAWPTVYTVDLSNGLLTTVLDSCPVYGDMIFHEDSLYGGVWRLAWQLAILDPATFQITSVVGECGRWVSKYLHTSGGTVLAYDDMYCELYSQDMAHGDLTERLLIGGTEIECIVEERPRGITKRTSVVNARHSRSLDELRLLETQYRRARKPWRGAGMVDEP